MGRLEDKDILTICPRTNKKAPGVFPPIDSNDNSRPAPNKENYPSRPVHTEKAECMKFLLLGRSFDEGTWEE